MNTQPSTEQPTEEPGGLRQAERVVPWLFTIARRTATDRLRADYRRRAIIDDHADFTTVDERPRSMIEADDDSDGEVERIPVPTARYGPNRRTKPDECHRFTDRSVAP